MSDIIADPTGLELLTEELADGKKVTLRHLIDRICPKNALGLPLPQESERLSRWAAPLAVHFASEKPRHPMPLDAPFIDKSMLMQHSVEHPQVLFPGLFHSSDIKQLQLDVARAALKNGVTRKAAAQRGVELGQEWQKRNPTVNVLSLATLLKYLTDDRTKVRQSKR
jgi:hypothetical protein